MTGFKTNSGDRLRRKWNLQVQQARYHKDGTFYMPLDRFPAALCDPHGYVIFSSKEQYESCQGMEIGIRLNVRGGIVRIPGYVRAK